MIPPPTTHDDKGFPPPRGPADLMTRPEAFQTRSYCNGITTVNGFDAWSLFLACAEGDQDRVTRLLDRDPRLVNAQFWYRFPIHLAVREGHLHTVKLLLSRGADPGLSNFMHRSWAHLLDLAARRDDARMILLLERAMKRRFHYARDFRPLKDAILARDSRRIRQLLGKAPQLAQSSDKFGNSPLHLCVLTRQRELFHRFLESGTPIDSKRADGQTPVSLAIHVAYDYGNRGIRDGRETALRNAWVMVGDLLARGARLTLPVAAAVGDRREVDRQLQRRPELANRLDPARISPLSYAAREGYPGIVESLLKHGAEPNRAEDLAPSGRALYEACAGNHLEVARLLLDHGADPNAGVDSCGCCVWIARYHHPRTSRALCALLRLHGAITPPYALSATEMRKAIADGNSVVRHEEFLGNVVAKRDARLLESYLRFDPSVPQRLFRQPELIYPHSAPLVRLLLDRGLDPTQTDWNGKTLLHACAERGDRTVASLLLDAGADINARELEFKCTPLAASIRSAGGESGDEVDRKHRRQEAMVRFLLKRGAAVELPDDEPWSTPRAWAKTQGLTAITSLLESHSQSARDP